MLRRTNFPVGAKFLSESTDRAVLIMSKRMSDRPTIETLVRLEDESGASVGITGVSPMSGTVVGSSAESQRMRPEVGFIAVAHNPALSTPNTKSIDTAFARRWFKRLTRFGVAVVGAWLGLSFLGAWLLTRRVEPLSPEPVPDVDWAKFETTRLKTSDGQDLGGWYVDGREYEKPSVLILHGHGGSRAWCLPQAKIFTDAGCAVFLISMRASGDSTGDSTDIGYSARKDVEAAVEWLRERRADRPVYVMGISMGAAAAIFAAKDVGEKVAGYILESPFRDLKTAVRNRAEIYLPKPWSQVAYSGLVLAAPAFVGDVDRIAPIRAIDGIPDTIGVTILYGDKDNRARPEEARDLFDRVRNHARLVEIVGGKHFALRTAQPEKYREELLKSVGVR